MKVLKAGIVGCGNIFPMHAYSIVQNPNVELTAICDNKPERAKKCAEEFNCACFTDYKDMIDNAGIDVVHICTPHYMHSPIAVYAAQKGKHVLTEKPMAIKLEDAELMVKTAKDNDVVLGVIFQNRYNSASKLIKETLESGIMGKVLSGRLTLTWDRSDEYYSKSDWKGTWEKEGGGVIIDQAIHTFDLMNWFINDKIELIDAQIGNRGHDHIEVEDMSEGIIKYKSGAVIGFYTINYYSFDAPVEIEIHCENGLIKMAGDRAVIKFPDGRELIADKNPNEVFGYGDSSSIKSYWGVNHIKQINNFYNALVNGTQPDITGEVALETQKMICAIYESGKTKEKIRM